MIRIESTAPNIINAGPGLQIKAKLFINIQYTLPEDITFRTMHGVLFRFYWHILAKISSVGNVRPGYSEIHLEQETSDISSKNLWLQFGWSRSYE